MTPEEYAAEFKADLHDSNNLHPRHQYRLDGNIGASDFLCRQLTAYILDQAEPTDDPENWAAFVGTALDAKMQTVRARAHPSLIFDAHPAAVLRLANNEAYAFEVSPDEINPVSFEVTDYKTKDGLSTLRRGFVDESYRRQRHIQGLACVQTYGWEPADVVVRNVFVDRSGNDPNPHVEQEAFSWKIIEEAESFLSDAVYAHTHRERTHQDKPRSFCEVACVQFERCRGDEIFYPPIFDETQIRLVEAYYDANMGSKMATQLKKEIKPMLHGLTGLTPEHQVTWRVDNKQTGPVEVLTVTKRKK